MSDKPPSRVNAVPRDPSVTFARKLKPVPPQEALTYGRYTTDHMLSMAWTAQSGWQNPELTPYRDIPLDPAACVLYYGFQVFEGLKAYKDSKGVVRLFRPDKNMSRMNHNARRLGLPEFNTNAIIQLLMIFARTEGRWIGS